MGLLGGHQSLLPLGSAGGEPAELQAAGTLTLDPSLLTLTFGDMWALLA